MQKTDELYSGKVKTIFKTDDPNRLIMHFRDDISAFNAQKMDSLAGKGAINNRFNAFIMEKLAEKGVPTHHISLHSDNESVVKNLKMIPVECVIRNVTAGSITKRLAVEEGRALTHPIFEFFYKDDELGDPLINDHHILAFGWATQSDIETMRRLTFAVNDVLKPLFEDKGLCLVDYKLEFGHDADGQVVLGDEFTADGCRIWDLASGQRLDKDRFRHDLGDVVASYETVAERLGMLKAS